MLTILGRRRRKLLQIGSAGLFGLALPELVQAETAPAPRTPRAKSVLFVFLYGGPSQLETFDMKPDAASTIRGPFRPIASRTPGLRICEHLPRLAERSNQFSVVRTLNHPQNDHNGTHFIQTGHPLPPANRGAANVDATDLDWPAFGSVIDYLDQRAAGGKKRAFPGFVYLPKRLGHFAGYDINGQYAGWLGRAYNPMATDIRKRDALDNPFFRDCTDDELDFRLAGLDPQPGLTLDRFQRRESLLEQFDAQRTRIEQSPAARDFDSARERALSLLTSNAVRSAFDIRHESDKLRDQYGRNLFGQSMLMGRRLIEAGARFVTVAWDLAVRGDVAGSWDMHASLERVMQNHLLPGLDLGFSALLDDMNSRGLLDNTLIVCAGEMGRTPKFENRGQQDGRDHWTYCFPCVLAGAGIRGGTTYGQSDKDAAYPLDCPVTPADLACTIYDSLGIDPHSVLHDPQNRPIPLVDGGQPLRELIS